MEAVPVEKPTFEKPISNAWGFINAQTKIEKIKTLKFEVLFVKSGEVSFFVKIS